MTETWDFAHQRAETEATVIELSATAGLTPAHRITLDLQFVPRAPNADRSALERALKAFGYTPVQGDETTVTVSVSDVAFTIEAIWEHEERTSRIALARGFEPDGWGFWEP